MDEIIELVDELGNQIKFKVVASFGLDDLDYAALVPVDEATDLTYILRIDQDEDGSVLLSGIDDEEELNDAIEAFEEIQEGKLQ